MYHVKMAFVLIQVGTNLWVNPMQVAGIKEVPKPREISCSTFVIYSDGNPHCTDWTIEKVREALAPAVVAKAMEGK